MSLCHLCVDIGDTEENLQFSTYAQVLVYLAAVAAGLAPEQIVTLTVVGGMPAAVNVYIITDKMGGDGSMACGAVVVTHLVSLFTMTGIVFILRSAGLI